MYCPQSLLVLGVLIMIVVANNMLDDCLRTKRKYTMNVVLLEDNTYDWSRPFVQAAMEEAIEEDRKENIKHGLNLTLTANYNGFNTTVYNRQGCGSSTCEGVAILKRLHSAGEVGCVMLGPSCTYATFQLVDQEIGLTLSIPIISAGSFGVSCNYKPNLTRILPPARKVSDALVNFINETLEFKDAWNKVYVYKKTVNYTEDCFWYINALEAASLHFAKNTNREMLRSESELNRALTSSKRHSNIFILCGSIHDIISITETHKEKLHEDILFILLDLYNPQYHVNSTSTPGMEKVLVVTLPERNFHAYGSILSSNNTINDYVAGYYDSVLLFGKALREWMLRNATQQNMESSDELTRDNPFGNISFSGMGGHYVLDEYGDRDVNVSFIYTSADSNKYQTLLVFDTSQNKTVMTAQDPILPWKRHHLPHDQPEDSDGKAGLFLNVFVCFVADLTDQDVIVIVLGVSVVVVTAIALIFYRQNRKERLMQKKWSHIDPHLIGPLNEKEISLKIDEDKRKDSTYYTHRGCYDKKPVILKELKHTDGDFTEDQKIELNTLLHIDYYNLTKFYGTVRFEYAVFGVFELCQRGSLRVRGHHTAYPIQFSLSGWINSL
ncbi:guanylyl cyclase C [Xenentodon cancila]